MSVLWLAILLLQTMKSITPMAYLQVVSRVIVTDLLKQKLGFKGIVVTDAMNMGALRKIENASLKAVEAGCDMILMEPNDVELHKNILEKYNSNPVFKSQIDQSVKKILRLKFCLNII